VDDKSPSNSEWEPPKVTLGENPFDTHSPCPTCGKSYNDPSGTPACADDHYIPEEA
jgi:hypothetical protein